MNIARLFTQPVSLETYLGSSAHGAVYAAPVTVRCFIEDASKLVRKPSEEEILSSTTLYGPLTAAPDDPATAGQFAPLSRVTVNGRVAHVITANRQDSAGPARIHHVEVHLT